MNIGILRAVEVEDVKLEKIWKKYVDKKYFYRTFSGEYLVEVKREGFNPLKNPYEKQKKDLCEFFCILDRLEKKGYYYTYLYWPRSKPIGSILSRNHRKSLKKNYIDLTPNNFDDLGYYEKRKGGDIPQTVYHVCEDLIKFDYPLTPKEMRLVLMLQKWSKAKLNYKNITIKIPATSLCLEKAYLERFLGKREIPSPFGSFDHFR